jgi:Flp pilus assembly protein CpaB
MQGGRTLIIIGAVILVLVLIVGAVLFVSSNLLSRSTPEPTVVPIDEGNGEEGEQGPSGDLVQIVVAAQNIPRGTRITADNNAVKTMMWPQAALPEGVLVDVTTTHGRIARQDIPIDMPITEGLLTSQPGDLTAAGSDAALLLPPGRVAFAMPVGRWSSVAWAIQPGDHVDVLVSLLIVELDEEFQTEPPNTTYVEVVDPETGERTFELQRVGRLEALPDGTLVMVVPREEWQRPGMTTQMVVQDAIVLGVGDWEHAEIGDVAAKRDELGDETQGGDEEVDPESAEAPTPTPLPEVRPLYGSVTLGVTPQDALILKYLGEVDASIDLVVRSTADAGDVYTTDAVTLDYVFERYAIDVPPKLPYGLSNPVLTMDPAGSLFPRRVLEGTEELVDQAVELETADKKIDSMDDTRGQ